MSAVSAAGATADGPAGGDARARSLALPIVSLVLAVTAALVTWRGAEELAWVVARLEAVAVSVLVLGLGLRSERLVALATGPALAGLLVGTVGRDEIGWGQALIVGCLWYLATEAALSSVEWSGGIQVAASVVQRRLLDVATVMLAAVSVVVLGFAIAGWAPDRTIAARVVVLVAVVAALGAGIRHLVTVDRPGDRWEPSEQA